MNYSKFRFTDFGLCALASALLLPLGALAQQAATPATTLSQGEVDEIVVTGSRIPRPDLTAASPIRHCRRRSDQALQHCEHGGVPAPVAAVRPGTGNNNNNGNDGGATIDLRNLGEERTLVLVNGKRFVPYDYQGYVDISMIPTSLIERVEIITGGASAVYGSEAVAGVVNFILKENFEGVEISGGYGETEDGDGDSYDFSVTVGGNFAGDRGNAVLNVGYSKKDVVTQGERSYSAVSLDNLLDPGGSYTIPGSTVFDSGYTGDTADGCAQFDSDGEISGTCDPSFNFNPYNLLQTPQQLWTATALADFEINDNLTVFTRASFANNQVDTIIAPTGTFFNSFDINYLDNPFLSPSAVARYTLVDAEDSSPGDGIVQGAQVGRRLVELGTRDSLFENTAYQFIGGLKGSAWEDHNWEVFAQYGHTSRNQNFVNDINIDKARLAFDAVDDGFGNPVCRINADADPGNDDPACYAADFFGAGRLHPLVGPYIAFGSLIEVDKTDQLIYGGSLSGDLPLQLPIADRPLGYAVGVERREEKGEARPDSNYENGLAPGFGSSSPVDAKITIDEVYGELLIPIVADAPLAKAINVETGIRYAKYENATTISGVYSDNDFYNTSWKLGADWSPTEDLRITAMFQRAVRAPTLQEIGLPRTSSTGDLINDPCDNDNPTADPDLIALCEATGVPVGDVGGFNGISAGQVNNFLGGNPGLEPEEADTWTVGFDWTPAFLEGLQVSVDYYDIEIDDAIVEISEQNIVNGCYQTEQDANGFFCSRIIRDPVTGNLLGNPTNGIDISRVNAATETAEGIDFVIRYAFDMAGMGSLDVGINANYVLERTKQDRVGTPINDCVGLAGKTCLRPTPEWSFVQSTRWTMGPATIQLNWRYLDSIEQDSLVLEAFRFDATNNPEGVSPSDFAVNEIASQSYFDLTGTFDLNETWQVRAGVDNLFDHEPPVVGNEWGGTAENSGNTYPAVYDALGRAFYVGASARF